MNLTEFLVNSRQEPVIYVAGRPHVLRRVDKPLENVEYVAFWMSSYVVGLNYPKSNRRYDGNSRGNGEQLQEGRPFRG